MKLWKSLRARFDVASKDGPTLALALLATAVGFALVTPAAAQTPVDFQKLTVQQRLALPGDTVVHIAGRSFTLRALQQQHAARLARFASAASNGLTAAAGMAPAQTTSPAGPAAPPPPPRVSMLNLSGFGADYQNFCRAARATVCLYYPSSLGTGGLFRKEPYGAVFFDVDPLMDGATCASAGGVMQNAEFGSGCYLQYPTISENYFVRYAHVQSNHSCAEPPYHWAVTDEDVAAEYSWAVVSAPNGATPMSKMPATACIVRVYGRNRPAPPSNSGHVFSVPTAPAPLPNPTGR